MKNVPKLPSYRFHRGSGQAVVTIHGKDIYLGVHDSPESQQRYKQVLAEYLATGSAASPFLVSAGLSVRDGMDKFAAGRIVSMSEKDAYHFSTVSDAVISLYGDTHLADFGPVRFKAVRESFVARGWARGHVNRQSARVREILQWLTGNELYPADKLTAIEAVPGLRNGQTTAPESKKIQPIDLATVEATVLHLPRPVRGVVTFQRWTGCRPGEAVKVRRGDISTVGAAVMPDGTAKRLPGVWVYAPSQHKNTWRGESHYILIGPRGQVALAEFMDVDASEYLFRPADVAKAPRPGLHYTPESYQHAVAKAAKAAKVKHWHPYQLRHRFAGEIRDSLTEEHAKEVLGHKQLDMTSHYTGVGLEKAAEAIRKVG